MIKNLLLVIGAFFSIQTLAQQGVFEHSFHNTKTATNYSVGTNLTLVNDRNNVPTNAIYLPSNQNGLAFHFTSEFSTMHHSATIAFWYKHENTLGNGYLDLHPILFMNNGNQGNNIGLVLGYNALANNLYLGSSNGTSYSTGELMDFNNFNFWDWNYYTISYENGIAKLYINGEYKISCTYYNITSTSTQKMYFGSYNLGVSGGDVASVTGYFDNISVHRIALNDDNALTLYRSEVPYYPSYSHYFIGTKTSSGFTVGDNLTLVNDRNGNSNNAIYLPSDHQMLTLDYSQLSSILKSTGTISFWVLFSNQINSGVLSSSYPVFYVPNGDTSFHEGIVLTLYPNNGGHLIRFGSSKYGSTNANVNSGQYLSSLHWAYITITYRAGYMDLYLNGEFIESKPFYELNSTTATRKMYFGGWNSTNFSAYNKPSITGYFDNITVRERFASKNTAYYYYYQELNSSGLLNLDEVPTQKDELKVYPNPVQDVLRINSSTDIKSMEVYNLLGQKQQLPISIGLINVNSLPAGNYILKIALVDGTQKAIKFIKK